MRLRHTCVSLCCQNTVTAGLEPWLATNLVPVISVLMGQAIYADLVAWSGGREASFPRTLSFQ
ncbi:hypothetical protein J6590_057099 [Homalodisca vitripennis]|nr:hypothetical protein J6590_057099 [Homalodisca vitripennis]